LIAVRHSSEIATIAELAIRLHEMAAHRCPSRNHAERA
jgi:hypothetical protein